MGRIVWVLLVWGTFLLGGGEGCGPGRGAGKRPGAPLTPLVFKQHVPNVSENTLAASGLTEGRITRSDKRFNDLVPNYNSDIIFKDEEGTGADRLMTQRCMEKLNTLAITVMNQWPGVRLRVIEGWDEQNAHAADSLHYEGRAVDISTSDRDRSKLGMLARLAIEAGFDWVYYESRVHIHCSVKSESSQAAKSGGCFSSNSTVELESGARKTMSELVVGDSVKSHDGEKVVYSEVIMFLDRDTESRRQFLRLRTRSAVLRVTPQHLVLRAGAEGGGAEAVFAARVRPGDSLLVAGPGGVLEEQRVENVTLAMDSGVVAPLTKTGTIVVDGVLASCYAVVESQGLAHAAFGPLRLYTNAKEGLVHLYSALTMTKPKANRSAGTPSGIPWYPRLLYRLSSFVVPPKFIYDTSDAENMV